MKEFMIHKNEENQRLDKYLKKLLPNASTGFLYKMLRKKNIVYNGKKAAGNEILSAGDTIQIYFSDETFEKFHADMEALQKEYDMLRELPEKGLPIIYEDADILAADKPADMLSQKADQQEFSANEYLLGYLIRSGSLSLEAFSTFRPSVCNRLDRNTTGLLLMGKSLAGSQQLSEMLRARTIKKYYRAVVAGTITEPAHLSGYLIKDAVSNQVTVIDHPAENAAAIDTEYRPLKHTGDATLLEIHLITGKTHQIRAHLADAGYPVIGDPKYGNPAVNRKYRNQYGVSYQMLHAYRLEFPDGKVLKAPMPDIYHRIMV